MKIENHPLAVILRRIATKLEVGPVNSWSAEVTPQWDGDNNRIIGRMHQISVFEPADCPHCYPSPEMNTPCDAHKVTDEVSAANEQIRASLGEMSRRVLNIAESVSDTPIAANLRAAVTAAFEKPRAPGAEKPVQFDKDALQFFGIREGDRTADAVIVLAGRIARIEARLDRYGLK